MKLGICLEQQTAKLIQAGSLHLQDEGCKIFTLWEYKTGPPLSVALNVEGHGNGMEWVCAVKDAGSHQYNMFTYIHTCMHTYLLTYLLYYSHLLTILLTIYITHIYSLYYLLYYFLYYFLYYTAIH